MEINVGSPGDRGTFQERYGVDFAPAVIEELERKVGTRVDYSEIDNRRLATS